MYLFEITLKKKIVAHINLLSTDLEFGKLATGFGLLRLPKMPELKNKIISDFTPVDMDFNSIKYQ